ncbi:flagellar hook-basal body complex protein FliE [Oricola sp.]|uniref:flagellar hook-basal body complex protein FliE n=1 Tax=Oricola sp. TaxID=1979950 RepID=UPI003BA8FC92
MANEFAIAAIAPIDPSRIGAVESAPTSGAARIEEPSFAEALRGITADAVNDIRHAEEMSFRGITGEADIRDVTDAVMSAEQSLSAAVAIRDKIVTAFLEVSRMQI